MFDDDSNLKDGGQKKPQGNGFNRIPVFTLLAWAGIIAAAVVLFMMKQHITTPANPMQQATFLDLFASNQIASATVIVNQQTLPLSEVTGNLVPDKDAKATKDATGAPVTLGEAFVVHNAWFTPEQLNLLTRSKAISISAPNVVVMNLLWGIAPFLILGVLFWFFFIRQIKAAGKGALSFGKSKARMLAKDRNKTTFKDVAGVDEAIEEVSELVEFLKDPKKFQRLGGRIPKGVLMVGPPGTGKTSLARGLASRTAASLGSDLTFIEVDPHALASAAHGKTQQAVSHLLGTVLAEESSSAPCIVLLDEVETLAASRNKMSMEANPVDVHRATDAVLTQLDQLAARFPQLLFIATSNFAGAIDEAFLSRADLIVTIDLPTPEACRTILIDTLDRLAEVFPKIASLRNSPQIDRAASAAAGLDARRIRKAVLSALADTKQIAANPDLLTADAVLAAIQQAKAEHTHMVKPK
jgi:ATP-dependent Zn protease